MSLDRCMKEHTERQLNLRLYWLREQWNRPSRDNNYAMQIACEVRRLFSKDPSKVHMKDFHLEFKFNKAAPPAATDNGFHMTPELASSIAKAKWFGAMTLPIEERSGEVSNDV